MLAAQTMSLPRLTPLWEADVLGGVAEERGGGGEGGLGEAPNRILPDVLPKAERPE